MVHDFEPKARQENRSRPRIAKQESNASLGSIQTRLDPQARKHSMAGKMTGKSFDLKEKRSQTLNQT